MMTLLIGIGLIAFGVARATAAALCWECGAFCIVTCRG